MTSNERWEMQLEKTTGVQHYCGIRYRGVATLLWECLAKFGIEAVASRDHQLVKISMSICSSRIFR